MQNLNLQRKAFLDMLAWSEGTDNGWQKTRNHGYDVNPITYDGGTLLDLNRHELIYQFDFSVISELTEDDTRQQDELNSLDELRTLAIDVDYFDPGNGPDGDIEHHTEITLPS